MKQKYFSYVEAIKYAIQAYLNNFLLFLIIGLVALILIGGFVITLFLLIGLLSNLDSYPLIHDSYQAVKGYIPFMSSSSLSNLKLPQVNPKAIFVLVPIILIECMVFAIYNACFIKICLKVYDKQEINFNDAFVDFAVLGRFIIVSFLYYLMVCIGLIFFIIPGLILGVKYFASSFLVIDKNSGIMESFSKSAQIASGVKLRLIGFNILIGIFSGFLGVNIITAPIILLAQVYVYRTLSEQTEEICACN